jgi:hypothetical protein
MTLGDSILICLPLGDGTKIRGQRANVIIADEFACLRSNSLVETAHGLMRIEDCVTNRISDVINKNGEYEEANGFIKTPLTECL